MSEALDHIRSRIEELGMDFQFIKTIHTSMNGVERETWLLEYEGSQFVYVAGQKNVTLGWDIEQCPMGEELRNALRKEFELSYEYYQDLRTELLEEYQEQIMEASSSGDSKKTKELKSELEDELKDFDEEMLAKGYTSWESFMTKWTENLSQCLSPLRTVDIGDMIVEVDSRYIEKDAESLSHIVSLLNNGLFTLATEDEWEYLCNGGTRTLFRWGDFLDDNIRNDIYDAGSVSRVFTVPEDHGDELSALQQPNMLGLFISYNSYKFEIIDNIQYVKGGDGGGSLCGGDGPVYVFPCYAAFYRYEVHEGRYGLSKNFYSYRRIIRMPQ